ncbi:transcriptional regulator [Leeuwenhoekiella nanhaiensis]|uniref:Transcriptional regulator n=1 Tax=Leeuwenhoekiella nanhaiensis TaxID=1655491 RepID=A0A2G1VVT7_9FLAO|nr:transcriptional regulator [Leeuwenhoekiella nanhaiensis]
MTSVKESDLDNIRAELLKNVGKNIQRIREQKGLSQFDLITKMLGEFDVTNVSRIESGRNNPTLFTLYRIAKALDVSLPQLLDYSTTGK